MNQNRITIQDYFNMDIEQRSMPQTLAQVYKYDLHLILNENISEREKVAVITELNRRQMEEGIPQNYGHVQAPAANRYSLAYTLGKVLWVFSWIMYGFAFLSFMIFLFDDNDYYSSAGKLIIGIRTLLTPAVIGISLMATSELIKLWIDITQSNKEILQLLNRKQ